MLGMEKITKGIGLVLEGFGEILHPILDAYISLPEDFKKKLIEMSEDEREEAVYKLLKEWKK